MSGFFCFKKNKQKTLKNTETDLGGYFHWAEMLRPQQLCSHESSLGPRAEDVLPRPHAKH